MTLSQRLGKESLVKAYLLNLLYAVLLLVCLPWLALDAIRKGKYRQGLGQKLLGLAAHAAIPTRLASGFTP